MRLTILINGSDPSENHDYAVLWLDMEDLRWSREAHSGVDLPSWGIIRTDEKAITLLDSASPEPLCILRRLRIGLRNEISGADGPVTLSEERRPGCLIDWHWRLQAVDRTSATAEHTLFAAPAAPSPQRTRQSGQTHPARNRSPTAP